MADDSQWDDEQGLDKPYSDDDQASDDWREREEILSDHGDK